MQEASLRSNHIPSTAKEPPVKTPLPKVLSALLLTIGLSLMATQSASARVGSEFGHHVQSCAQGMGFDGTHNPGMHSGYAGWDPTHVC
jgi:hypothetical protein